MLLVLAGAFWRVFPSTVPWWFWWRFSLDLLALFLQLCWLQLCVPVKVLPRIALRCFWWRFFPGVLRVRFGPLLCCPLWFDVFHWLGCVLVRSSQDDSWHFWWRLSPKLPGVALVVAALSLSVELSRRCCWLDCLCYSLLGHCQSRCGAPGRASRCSVGQRVSLFVSKFSDCAGGTLCVFPCLG
ncbi:hypothetical protein Taro_005403 [Colocasia esculenta]|uniref:Uncharacterized protein n=1 Tax=Colocasia esculenta TaxID=4460 RepID=A0A843TS92_COLES|nr:hypothetical protein [Colocasia esculenta]